MLEGNYLPVAPHHGAVVLFVDILPNKLILSRSFILVIGAVLGTRGVIFIDFL